MSPSKGAVDVRVGDRTLRLTNLDKVYWPEVGFTKGQMIDYYSRIAPVLLPHLEHRPLTLKRYPEGVGGEMFYEKNCPKHRPEWMHTARVWSDGNDRYMYYCVVDDLPSLVWVAQLGTIELHTSMSLSSKMSEPRAMVFDLDPGPPATIVECCQVAMWVRDWLRERDLQSFPKTSGSKGMQIYVPLNMEADYDRTKTVSRTLAQQLERRYPKQVVSIQRKTLREGKVLIDWSQNDEVKTTINVYSLRARERPTASAPLRWEEVEQCLEAADPSLLVFESDAVLDRVATHGDLFEPLLTLRQPLPDSI